MNLFFPLGFEGGRSDHQSSRYFPQTLQESAGCDGLYGLPEPHLVGQEGPFFEGEVQHPFALVRVKRRQSFLRRPFPGLDFLFIFPEQDFALLDLLSCLEPGGDLLGDAEVGNMGLTDLFQNLLGFCAPEPAMVVEEPA